MKKAVTILIILLCMIMTGCSNEFARMEYDSSDKISKKWIKSFKNCRI